MRKHALVVSSRTARVETSSNATGSDESKKETTTLNEAKKKERKRRKIEQKRVAKRVKLQTKKRSNERCERKTERKDRRLTKRPNYKLRTVNELNGTSGLQAAGCCIVAALAVGNLRSTLCGW